MPVLSMVVEQLLAPVPGGTGRVTSELATALAGTAPDGWRLRAVCGWHADIDAAVISDRLRPHRLPAGRRALAALWERGLPPWVRGDVVLAPTPLFPARFPVGRQRRIVIVHDAVPYTHPETLTPRGVGWHRRMIERAATEADAIVVPATAVADELADHLRSTARMSAIGWGVGDSFTVPIDAARRRALFDLPARYLVFVGTVEPRKGLDLLIAALGIATAGPTRPLPLVLVGPDGWGQVDLERLVAAAALPTGSVLPLGRLADADLASVMTGATALVAPSRSEGFGLPVLEAMTLGVPVITSDAPALVELTAGAGLTVPREDPAALAAALLRIDAEPALRQRLTDDGRHRAARYSWNGAARQLWELITH
jgi:glycosyltransferase involved in cell wall biosynthesis